MDIKKAMLLIGFGIVLFLGLQNIAWFLSAAQTGIQLLVPFILGGVIAFIVNVPMRALEQTLFTEKRKKRYKFLGKMARPIALVFTLFFLWGLFMILVFTISPQIQSSIITLRNTIPSFLQQVDQWIRQLVQAYPQITDYANELMVSLQSIDWRAQVQNLFDWLQNGNLLNNTFSVASSILGGLTNFVLGFIFAIYILLQKEKLAIQCKKLFYAWLPEQVADSIVQVLQLTQKTFSSFISGQCLEACILGTLFFISMSIIRLPYASVVSVIIAFTSLIPIFGAFIGCFIGVFFILIQSPIQAIWFLILFLVLQQIEGNLIYPHVVGGSVGLPSIWVLVAVTTGASTMGVLGMLINIPLFSVIYTLLKQHTNMQLRKRKIKPEKFK